MDRPDVEVGFGDDLHPAFRLLLSCSKLPETHDDTFLDRIKDIHFPFDYHDKSSGENITCVSVAPSRTPMNCN